LTGSRVANIPEYHRERRRALAAAHQYAMHSRTRAQTCSHLPWKSPSCVRSALQTTTS